ncbi:MAG: zinc-ribbon domain-containing protein [Wolbachia endosymbiont of Homalodisca vitripennis]|uniref:Zinc finger/thioredoxin putative domain-containing protein n=1 Tax=Wolbachia endosymbiont of Aleurodicus dispersus TaxID=1288877 RepID=A0A3B0JE32_9RICK|nr:zinc-ribbon domain-containing protein [Wolbachia endosymbiont of Homalodisca vitripennis]MCJ7454539.1 zinc-ribbon domain-containing protein [Wolbachia endosymbiont of Homalodisca vitripennis]MCJ7476351.1 zinc-ribbon domain-containing protein [Wolbachia endosymbiont of Homalodisca vitripennis]
MKIQCHNCTKTYLVSREQIGESGRKVKCTNCNHMWHEYLKEMSSELCPANMQEKKASWRQNLALAFATVAGLCVIIVGGIFPGEVSKIYKVVSSYKDSISYKLGYKKVQTENSNERELVVNEFYQDYLFLSNFRSS